VGHQNHDKAADHAHRLPTLFAGDDTITDTVMQRVVEYTACKLEASTDASLDCRGTLPRPTRSACRYLMDGVFVATKM
jgi:hypothetical protein